MDWLDFQSFPLWLNLGVFAVAMAAIWAAGTRLAQDADIMADRTGLGQALIGMLLLATITSLPEIASISTASWNGNATLAANNLLGGVALQVTILAVADAFVVRGALTFFTPRFVLLLQGVLLILLLTLALAGVIAGIHFSVFHVGLWSIVLFAAYLLVLQQIYRYRGSARWVPEESHEERAMRSDRQREDQERQEQRREQHRERSNARLILATTGFGLVILAGGWTVAQIGDALAEQTGLGQSLVGATLVSLATSMPELSTTISAARMGNYSMAVANIFGSDAFMVALFLVADIFYREGVVLQAVERPTQFTALLAIALVCIFLWGLLERKDRTVGGMGIDSALVLGCYIAGLGVLYWLS